MPFCPNPDCSYRKRHGEPAEYLPGASRCSDCGSALIDSKPVFPPKEEKVRIKRSHADFRKRLLLTLLLLVLWNALRHIGLPGIDLETFDEFNSVSAQPISRITIFSLGLISYVAAYIAIEIFALFLPPLKVWRENGYRGRARLVQTARWLTLVLALIQSYFLASVLEHLPREILYQPGLEFRLITMITLTAGTFCIIWIADMITKWGIGHGISLLLFASYVTRQRHDLARTIGLYDGHNPLKHYLGVALVIVVCVCIIVIVERTHRKLAVRFDDGREAFLPVKLTTAGVIPASWVSSLLLYPATLAGSPPGSAFWRSAAIMLTPGKPVYYAALVSSTIVLYYLFSFLFHRRKSLSRFLQDKGAMLAATAGTTAARFGTASLAAIYLCFFSVLMDITMFSLETPLDGLAIILIISIALDLMGEVRVRYHSGALVKVAEFQKPAEAGLLRSLLRQHKIPCLLRGYYHRALLYFFGPYIEISVFVPQAKAAEANEVIATYLKLS